MATFRTTSRPILPKDVPLHARRMAVGEVILIRNLDAKEIHNARVRVYDLNRNNYNSQRLYKTHARDGGLFIERWK